MRSEISEVVRTFFKKIKYQWCNSRFAAMGDNEILYNSYEFLALARTTIEKDFRGELKRYRNQNFPQE